MRRAEAIAQIAGDAITLPTREFLAARCSAPATTPAGELQRAGLIPYVRGDMTIVDRPGPEQLARECYRVVRAQFERLLAIPLRRRPG